MIISKSLVGTITVYFQFDTRNVFNTYFSAVNSIGETNYLIGRTLGSLYIRLHENTFYTTPQIAYSPGRSYHIGVKMNTGLNYEVPTIFINGTKYDTYYSASPEFSPSIKKPLTTSTITLSNCSDFALYANGHTDAEMAEITSTMLKHYHLQRKYETPLVFNQGATNITYGSDLTTYNAGYVYPRQVRLTQPFCVSETQITKRQWKAVMGTEPWSTLPNTNINFDLDSPCQKISNLNVNSFITNFNSQTGKTFLLPTEAEWEFMAKGGTENNWFFGNITKFNENYVSNFVDWNLTPPSNIYLYEPNIYGIYGLHLRGITEWCRDAYAAYTNPFSNVTDPYVTSGFLRVVRNGAISRTINGVVVNDVRSNVERTGVIGLSAGVASNSFRLITYDYCESLEIGGVTFNFKCLPPKNNLLHYWPELGRDYIGNLHNTETYNENRILSYH
jgi:formylglycine-generating enzyme required for sulfatase activity